MLSDPIFRCLFDDSAGDVTLPGLFARLCDASLRGFDGLAAHQRHGWLLFLCQTAALALVRSGEADAADDDDAWRALADAAGWHERLTALTPGCADTAWSLVVDDVTKPAFMQPAITTGDLAAYKVAGATPDAIDVLVTAKAHDVKAARLGGAELRHWAFALVTLQTMAGYAGRGNFGIARMNGGFASRPLVTLAPSRDLAAMFRRGVRAGLAARRGALALQEGFYRDDGLGLLWLEPWDTDAQLDLADLDPLFVEVCRRIRLVGGAEGRTEALGRPSLAARVHVPKDAKGDLGDPWTPINTKEGSALTVGGTGLDYRLVSRLLARDGFDWPKAMDLPLPPCDRAWFHAAVLVRGQGKTEGLHERWLPVKGATMLRLRGAPPTAGALGNAMITDADAAKKALRTALLAFLQGGPDRDELDLKDDRGRDVLVDLDQRIDRIFFAHWFERIDAADDPDRQRATRLAWQEALVRAAAAAFDMARKQASPPDCRIERAHAVAEMVFWRTLRQAGLLADEEVAA